MPSLKPDKPDPLPIPPPVQPPPQNLEEIARQRRAIDRKRVNRQDFIIDPTSQGLNIPS